MGGIPWESVALPQALEGQEWSKKGYVQSSVPWWQTALQKNYNTSETPLWQEFLFSEVKMSLFPQGRQFSVSGGHMWHV